MCTGLVGSVWMSDTEARDQRPTAPSEPRVPVRQEQAHPGQRGGSHDTARRDSEQARLADLQRCIDSMRRVAGDLEARVADLECSMGRVGSAFGQMAGLHEMVVAGASRGRGAGYHTDRGGGGRRDFYNRQDPPHHRGDHAPPPFAERGEGGGRGRARRP